MAINQLVVPIHRVKVDYIRKENMMAWNKPYARTMTDMIRIQQDNWGRLPGQCLGAVGNDIFSALDVPYSSYVSADVAGRASDLRSDYPGRPCWMFWNVGDGDYVTHIGFGTPDYIIQCWRYVPNLINADPDQKIGWATLDYMNQRMRFSGFALRIGANQDLAIVDDLGGGAPSPGGGGSGNSVWVPGMTDYAGNMGLQELWGARWFNAVTPWSPDTALSNVLADNGVSIDQALAWNDKWLNSKYNGIGDGGGFVTRGMLVNDETYYAGNRLALNDVAQILADHDAALEAQQRADLEAGTARMAVEIAEAAKAIADAAEAAVIDVPEEVVAPTPTPTPIPAPTPAPQKVVRKEDVMVLQNLPQVTVEEGALDRVIEDPNTRKAVYSFWTIFGLVLLGVGSGVVAGAIAAQAATSLGWETWMVIGVSVFSGIAAAYTAITPQVTQLSRANTVSKTPTP